MIRPPEGFRAAFSDAGDGDMRRDLKRRAEFSARLGLSDEWATVTQVHGNGVVRASATGDHGEADAIWSNRQGLVVGIFTADCLGVVMEAEDAVGVAHAGWRGAAAGVVANLVEAMSEAGHPPVRAAVGPGIGPCCFEVGPEVSARFPGHSATTNWGTDSVDLASHVATQTGVPTWQAEGCTKHDDAFFSHRRDRTELRMAAVGWMG